MCGTSSALYSSIITTSLTGGGCCKRRFNGISLSRQTMMFYDRHELHLYDIILIRLKTFITLEILFICTFCNAGGGVGV